MTLATLFFYLFATVAIASAAIVVAARNPVHSVLFLILTFVNAAGLLMLAGAEFLALILVVVYVGAVAVLFLFVVMMLDVDFAELRQGFLTYLPTGLLIAAILLVELVMVFAGSALVPSTTVAAPMPPVDLVTNTRALGRLLYTKYIVFFQTAGLILLVAMIGAIVLALRQRAAVKRQSVAAQIGRKAAGAVALVDLRPGQGMRPS
ncbi:MAG: NADH-quinone oxidoreductase subunit J [Bauldia sp.]